MNTSNHFEQAAAAQQRTRRRVRAGEPVQADAFAGPTRRVDPAAVQPHITPQASELPPSTWRVHLSDLACALLLCGAVMGATALAVAVATR